MNAELKAKWVEALRSGKYQQGNGILRSTKNEFCCLGVLCDLVTPSEWTEGQSRYSILGAVAWLPKDLRERVNLPATLEIRLIELNDKDHEPFADIADWIEQNIPADAS